MRKTQLSLFIMLLLVLRIAIAQERQFTAREMQLPVYKLLADLHRSGPGKSMWNVSPQDGRLLQMLVRMSGAKNVLEIGTSNGVSAIWMALGLEQRGGKLTTLEIDPARARLARENFIEAGVNERIELVEGDAVKILPTLTGVYDMVFIDAAKSEYKEYLDLIYSRIVKGGVIVAHPRSRCT